MTRLKMQNVPSPISVSIYVFFPGFDHRTNLTRCLIGHVRELVKSGVGMVTLSTVSTK
jgi:hypothetical protein